MSPHVRPCDVSDWVPWSNSLRIVTTDKTVLFELITVTLLSTWAEQVHEEYKSLNDWRKRSSSETVLWE